MIYSLTDYSAKELGFLAEANADLIHLHKEMDRTYSTQSPEMQRLMSGNRKKNAEKLKFFREHNVHLLTALQIVKDRETVQQS